MEALEFRTLGTWMKQLFIMHSIILNSSAMIDKMNFKIL